MEARNFALSALLFFVTSQTWAVGDAFVPSYRPGTCIVNASDPFEPNQKMRSGPLAGLCINPVLRRTAEILPMDQARRYFPVRAGDVVVSNFSHRGQFWLARIPVSSATAIRLLTQYFPITKLPVVGAINVAHTQFRFSFSEGQTILLKPQTRETSLQTPAEELTEMIFSVENTGPYGEKFDAKKGLRGHYNIAYRAVSVADKYDWMVVKQGHLVSQHALHLPLGAAGKILLAGLHEGTMSGLQHEYGTLGPNCSTELLVFIDRVLGIQEAWRPAIPNYMAKALRQRGLLKNRELPSLNVELERIQK